MKVLELFCGTKSISKEFEKRGHQTFTIDIDKKFNPNLAIDILKFDISMLPAEWRKPDVIWSSPPCTTFSVASIYRYWTLGFPKNNKALYGIKLLNKTREIIKQLKPKYWFIENPRGMMRRYMPKDSRNTISYCQYGFDYQKPTDIWTNNLYWKPKPICTRGASCHEYAKRSSRKGVQSKYRSPILRSIIPPKLCEEICRSCEK